MAKIGKRPTDDQLLEGGGGGGGMGRGSSLQMKHQSATYGPEINRRPDTSKSLAERSHVRAEVPNVTKSTDGHPTVKFVHHGNAGASRVEPTITPTSVKKIESDKPIPKFLLKNVEPKGMAKGGKVSSASSRADGCAVKGKTKGRFV